MVPRGGATWGLGEEAVQMSTTTGRRQVFAWTQGKVGLYALHIHNTVQYMQMWLQVYSVRDCVGRLNICVAACCLYCRPTQFQYCSAELAQSHAFSTSEPQRTECAQRSSGVCTVQSLSPSPREVGVWMWSSIHAHTYRLLWQRPR